MKHKKIKNINDTFLRLTCTFHKTFLFSIVLLSYVLISCSPEDVTSKYLNHLKKLEKLNEFEYLTKNNYYLYDIPSINQSAGVYIHGIKKNQNEKIVMQYTNSRGLNTDIFLKIDGSILNCDNMTISGMSPMGCSKGYSNNYVVINRSSEIKLLKSLIDYKSIKISYDGQTIEAGRPCDKFSLDVKNDFDEFRHDGKPVSEWESLFKSKGSRTIKMCLDKTTGFVLNFTAYTKKRSELLDQDIYIPIVAHETIKFSEEVDEKELVLPVTFSKIKLVCDKGRAVSVIDPYVDYVGNIKVKTYESNFPYQSIAVRQTLTLSDKRIEKNRPFAFEYDFNSSGTVIYHETCLGDSCYLFQCEYYSNDFYCLSNTNDEAECKSTQDCVFVDEVCIKFPCYKINNEEECKKHQQCIWRLYNYTDYYSSYCESKIEY